MQNPYANVFLCTGCKTSSSKWKKIFAQCQQLHHEAASPVPVRAAPPPDDKQPCIEDFFLSSARVPVLLPARSASWDAERFNDAQGGEAELSNELVCTDLRWSAPTALDEPG